MPDDALARVYDVEPYEVARRRAAAIERLADELGAQRGEDLGAVLQALLDEGTWISVEKGSENGEPELDAAEIEPLAPEVEPPAPDPQANGDAPETGSEEAAPEDAEPEQEAPEPEEDAAEPALEPVAAAVAVEERPVVPVSSEPVLEMLAAREGVRGPERKRRRQPRTGSRSPSLFTLVMGSFLAAVIGGAAAFAGFSEWDDDGGGLGSSSGEEPPAGARHFVPSLGGPIEAPFPSEPQSIACYSTAFVSGRTTLYEKPGGKVRIRLSPKTEWGSPRILGVIRRRGDWISVQAPELENGEVAWMPASQAGIDCVRWSMHADLSRRTLHIKRDGETVRRYEIAVGRAGNPTPRGRFTVTDKLRVSDPESPYGCCVLAVTGHQTRLPASWPGGDRLAIHATEELSSIGEAASLGCLRVTSSQARWMIRTLPLGTPLFVRA